jgi:hypothetical protein
MVRRITSAEADQQMPPPDSGKRLAPSEIATITNWIEQGADWKEHWSFVPPTRPTLPRTTKSSWARNPIDLFVLARMEQEGLAPSPEADLGVLTRRVTLDVTGLPPSLAEVRAVTGDPAPDAYERLVDRLLESPRYGEHQARYWLDLARYGDTHGLHLDNERSIWRYRDWVIGAFNDGTPFDRFSIEQLAGDLLPNPSMDQLIATGFHRCNITTSEGGAIDEEFLVRYAVDRVETTATTWLGLTAGCAACHNHKFDPISQTEFYQLFAYFYSLTEKAMDGNALLPSPAIKAPTPLQTRQHASLLSELDSVADEIRRYRAGARQHYEKWSAEARRERTLAIPGDYECYASMDEGHGNHVSLGREVLSGRVVGTTSWDAGRFGHALRFDGNTHVDCGDVGDFDSSESFSLAAWIYRTDDRPMSILSRMENPAKRGYDIQLADGRIVVRLANDSDKSLIRLIATSPVSRDKWHHLAVTYDGSSKAAGVKIYVDGRHQDIEVKHDNLLGPIRTSGRFLVGARTGAAPFQGMIDELRVYARELSPIEAENLSGADPIVQLLAIPFERRTSEQHQMLIDHFLNKTDATFRQLAARQKQAEIALRELERSFPSTLVMRELDTPRDTYFLIRGQYDQKSHRVKPGTPAVLPPLPENAPPNRLALANWLFDPNHPLTARVAVNRIWQQYFGCGIVKTAEDFGAQGEWPSHPELLDWLAVELVESGWDLKHVHRLIVNSSTYRQTSKASPELYARDPENRLLARGPRYRLDAEVIRDSALSISGLLVGMVGGKSVKPYQPEGVWEAVGYTTSNTARFQQDHGSALYRRSLYTFWKRTAPPPSMQILDAPSREVCVARRPRTNTPSGALVLLNDVQFVEAARQFAQRMIRQGGATADERIRFGFELATARQPDPDEIRELARLLDDFLVEYRADREAASALLHVGEYPRDESLDVADHAAWTVVANTILSLDETVTKH